jgi:hypothetical protein
MPDGYYFLSDALEKVCSGVVALNSIAALPAPT